MKLVGLTGGIGTGKSTVSGIFSELGATVVDADEAARAVVEPGTEGLRQVIAEFGPGLLRPDGSLDRARLAAIVFSAPERLQRLNEITWPLVGEWMAARTAESIDRGDEVVIHDIPLLLENPARQGMYERVILVYAPAEVALRRLVERGMTETDAQARIAAQMSIEAKRALASDVIDNSDSLEQTRRQVGEVWASLQSSGPSR